MEKKKPTEADIIMTLEAQAYGGLFPETPVRAKDILDFVNELREQNIVFKRILDDNNDGSFTSKNVINAMTTFYREAVEQAIEQGKEKLVKDTVKEIFDEAVSNLSWGEGNTISELRQFIKNRYGVEVD